MGTRATLPDPVITIAHPPRSPYRRALSGRGDTVYPPYWIAAAGLAGAMLIGVPLDHPSAVQLSMLVFIGGGLPHGAYDIALLRRASDWGRSGLWLVVAGYASIAVLMASLWMTVPLVALILFLVVASMHFGEDWQMLEEPLLRFAAGAAVIAAVTIGHRAAVSALFVAMSDPRAVVVAQFVVAAAPVVLLVTAVGVAVAWRDGSRQWAAAMTVCVALLLTLPPVAAFALYFVFLHSPRHLVQTRALLRDMTLARWLGTGALLSALSILGWWTVRRIAPSSFDPTMVAQAFQLLASVAVPHLILSRWLERQLVVVAPAQERNAWS